MWGLVAFLLLDSFIWERRSIACLSIPNRFSSHRRIACTLPTHHELTPTPINMLAAFPALTTIVERPFFFCLATDFTLENNLVVLCWTKCTSQSDPIHNKLGSHEDLAWRQLSWLLNWTVCLILANLSLDQEILPLSCETKVHLWMEYPSTSTVGKIFPGHLILRLIM